MSNGFELRAKAIGATKWSFVTQLASKLISPLTTIALARILAPEVIGVVSLVTMVTSFADLFSDAGFQNYLIQHEYENEDELGLSADVAFWTNLLISLLLWGGIALFRNQVASMVGDSSIGLAVAVACGSLPLTAAISVQTAVYQRSLDFKTLFYSRVGSALLIFFVSVPLAFFGAGYWSMIMGTLASNVFLAVWLTVRSEWKPSLRFSIAELKSMFSFSSWTLLESFSIWLTNWAGTFVLGRVMSGYYLGLYNTSTSLVNSALSIVSSAVNPVIFSSLSRLQDDRATFDSVLFSMQKAIALCIVPMTMAIFVFSDLFVDIILGAQWGETSTFFGLYALASAVVTVFGHTTSDAYRALGRPRLSLLAQLGFLAIMVPSLYIGAGMGYATFSIVVPIMRVIGSVSIHFCICNFLADLSPVKMILNLKWVYFSALLVALPMLAFVRLSGASVLCQVGLLILSVLLYLSLLLAIRDLRKTLVGLLDKFGITPFVQHLIPSVLIKESDDGKSEG